MGPPAKRCERERELEREVSWAARLGSTGAGPQGRAGAWLAEPGSGWAAAWLEWERGMNSNEGLGLGESESTGER